MSACTCALGMSLSLLTPRLHNIAGMNRHKNAAFRYRVICNDHGEKIDLLIGKKSIIKHAKKGMKHEERLAHRS